MTKTPLTLEQLRALVRLLGVSPRVILRTKDPAYAELGLESGEHSDAQLLELMSKHPGLIQRPIVVRGKRAVVARPIQKIETLLK